MPRQRKIKTVLTPIFTPVGIVYYERPENLDAKIRIAAILPREIVVAKGEYAALLHLKADKLHTFATKLEYEQVDFVGIETAEAGPKPKPKPKPRRKSKGLNKLVARVVTNTARLAALAEKARARRAAKK